MQLESHRVAVTKRVNLRVNAVRSRELDFLVLIRGMVRPPIHTGRGNLDEADVWYQLGRRRHKRGEYGHSIPHLRGDICSCYDGVIGVYRIGPSHLETFEATGNVFYPFLSLWKREED